MILYYNKPDEELDDWHKVIVKHVPPNIEDNILATYFNCDELIPDGTVLCEDNDPKGRYTVVSSYPIGDSIGYCHEVKEVLARPIMKSKLSEELEAIETDLSNDGPPEYYELTVDEQLDSDLTLYGMAYYITNEDGYKERLDPLSVVRMTRSRG